MVISFEGEGPAAARNVEEVWYTLFGKRLILIALVDGGQDHRVNE
jgi:hypothetical protein